MRPAISDVENGKLISADFCYKHHPEQNKIVERLLNYVKENEKIVGMNASGLTFSGVHLYEKKFYGCNFRYCFLINIQTEKIRTRLTAFDFAIFTDCNFIKSVNINSSFAGAKFIHVIYTDSEQIQVNFSGLQSYQSSFDNSNLYQSRFIKANLVDTSFRNCNLKRTIFYELNQTNISFRLSNTKEAIFDKRGSELFLGESKDGGIM